MEVRRTCRFAATVLTPAAARSGAKASRFDGDNIRLKYELSNTFFYVIYRLLTSAKLGFYDIGQLLRLSLDLGLVATLDHYPGEVLGS